MFIILLFYLSITAGDSVDCKYVSCLFEVKEQLVLNDQQIGQITKVHKLPNGDAVVFDRIVNSLYLINKRGEIKRPITRTGRGPGETIRIGDVAVSDNRIFVFDISNRKLVEFDHEGSYVSEIPHNSTSFHIAANDSNVYLFDTININIEKHLVSGIRINTREKFEVISPSSNLLKRMKTGTSGMHKNISLSDDLLCFVHPYEVDVTCVDMKTESTRIIESNQNIFTLPDAVAFANQSNPEAITHFTKGLFVYNNIIYQTVRDYETETDYLLIIPSDNPSASVALIDDVGIIGMNTFDGSLFTVTHSDNPSEDEIRINSFRAKD
jgi:hypothetical protein